MHIPSHEVAQRLSQCKNGQSIRQLAISLGYEEGYAATLSGVLRRVPGCITAKGENVLRKRLGLDNRRPRYLRPCLSRDPARRRTQLLALLAECDEQLQE